MPQLPSKTGREPQPPSGPAAHPSLGRPVLAEQGTVGASGEGVVMPLCCHQPGLAGGVRAPTFPRAPACLLEAHQRSALTHSLLGLLPRAHGDPLLPSLTFFLSGISLADASSRQRTLITPSHTLTMGPWLCFSPHWVLDRYLVSFFPFPWPSPLSPAPPPTSLGGRLLLAYLICHQGLSTPIFSSVRAIMIAPTSRHVVYRGRDHTVQS